MGTATWIRAAVLALFVIAGIACAPRAPRVVRAPAPAAQAQTAPPREPASEVELARYAARERQATGLEAFEGGRRGAQTTTIIIVLLVVIIVLLVV